MGYMILRIYLLAGSSAKFYMISSSIYTSFHIENIVMIVSTQDLDDWQNNLNLYKIYELIKWWSSYILDSRRETMQRGKLILPIFSEAI